MLNILRLLQVLKKLIVFANLLVEKTSEFVKFMILST